MRSSGAEWLTVAVGLALAGLLVATDRDPPLHPGAWTSVAITLVSSDSVELACGLDAEPSGFKCGYHADGSPRADRGEGLLVPCMTLDRQLLLVPELFREPAVAGRVAADVKQRVPARAQKRFTAHCRVHVVAKIRGMRARFHAAEALRNPESAWLVVPAACSVAPDGA